MKCVIYKSEKKQESYLYVEKEDDFSRVPATLQKMLGTLNFVMVLELTSERRLAQADVNTVMTQLRSDGFYLQMPRTEYIPIN